MVKKIFDIIPPKNNNEKDISGKELLKSKKRKVFLKKAKIFVISFLFLLFISSGIFSLFWFSEAEVKIWPKTRDIGGQEKIILSLEAPELDIENNIIPALSLENTVSAEREFSTSGKTKEERKAEGVITVYNEYSDSSRMLIPSRFVSTEGKIFWSKEKITIPGRKKEKNKIIPGQVEVKIEAAEPGEEYNIGPTTFVLPGLAGSPSYTAIYAKSFSSMAGGSAREVAEVAEGDLKSAERMLFEEAKERNKQLLLEKLPEGMVLVDAAILDELTKKESSLSVGDIGNSFKFKVMVFSKAFIFKKDGLDKIIKKSLKGGLEEGEIINEQKLILDYSSELGSDPKKIILNTVIGAEAYKEINLKNLKKSLTGKSAKAGLFLNSIPGASKIEFKLKPFLKASFPDDEKRIMVRVLLDD